MRLRSRILPIFPTTADEKKPPFSEDPCKGKDQFQLELLDSYNFLSPAPFHTGCEVMICAVVMGMASMEVQFMELSDFLGRLNPEVFV